MAPKALGVAIALVLVTLAVMGGSVHAQSTRPQGVSRNPGTNPALLVRCFVANCGKCNTFNPYICAQCNVGYQLTGAFSCNSCAPNYQQNLETQSFTCTACPPGTTSPGGTGEGSQCKPITVSSGRRLFEADEDDLWT